MSKTIDTLVQDIYHILDEDTDHEATEQFLEEAATALKDILRRRLAKQERKGSLRFSNLGRPDCQVWHKVNHPERGEKLRPETMMKFLYGDVLEILALYLAKEAGHSVSNEQAEVECDGVLGHIDAEIDGVVVDVKSASPFAFKKFADNRVAEDDPFGYIAQLSGYCNQLDKPGAFFAVNKESGGLCISHIPQQAVTDNPPQAAIDRQRKAVSAPTVQRGFADVPDGRSGNMALDTMCSYCDFKKSCWSDANHGEGLRGFLYSRGPKYLTRVVREPDVYELPN